MEEQLSLIIIGWVIVLGLVVISLVVFFIIQGKHQGDKLDVLVKGMKRLLGDK